MNIYMENKGLFKNYTVLKKLASTLNEEHFINIHIISQKRVSLLHLMMLSRVPKTSRMTLTIPIDKVPNAVISFANQNARFNLYFFVNKKIPDWHWKRIIRLNGLIEIYDSSNCIENTEKYNFNRYVIHKSLSNSNMDSAKIYMLSAGMITDCRFDSCLGKNLYISKNGEVSFCTKYPEKSKLGTITDLDSDIFDKAVFYETLQAMIDKRSKCQSNCDLFGNCQGGCVFECDCNLFKSTFDIANKDIELTIAEKHLLDSLPFYKEKAILHKLFCNFE